MAKVVLLADTHAGARENNLLIMEKQISFFEEQFFPFCEKYKIEHLIHLGDVFDVRKATGSWALYNWDERVFSKWSEKFKEVHIIIGNHDTYHKNTNKVNTPEKLLKCYDNFKFYRNPQELDLYGMKSLILPWICDDNKEESNKLVESSLADIVFGHLEIMGCSMFKGIENTDKGFNQSTLKKFKKVLSGHYHLKSTTGNIEYLGSPVATKWKEAFDKRGFHLLDTETLKLAFIENPDSPFVQIDYSDNSLDEIPNVKDKIVRLIVKKKSSESSYLQFLEKLEEQNPAELTPMDEVSMASALGDDEDHSGLDLFSLMDLYIDRQEFESPKEDLKKSLRDLWMEAVSTHDISE